MQNHKLEESLANYINEKEDFIPYYPGMNILTSTLYREQREEILNFLEKEDESVAKSFAIYHDTIIFNIHTKVRKYKQSQYFDNSNIKDIENQGYTIPFFIDEKRGRYILLGMVKSN